MNSRLTILGVPIDAVTRTEALAAAGSFLEGGFGRAVFTPNPEMLVLARRDREFRDILARGDLNIPDGFGLVLAAKWRGASLPERVTGTDLMQDISRLAGERGRRVFLLGGEPGVAAAAADVLKKRHPGTNIVGAESGGRVVRDAAGRLAIDPRAMAALKESRPEIVFVAFGHRSQEEWILQNLPELPTVRLAMGIGGAFDFIAGKAARAPKFMQMIGLEWFWRLIREPRRWRRIWNAVVVFPFLVITEKR